VSSSLAELLTAALDRRDEPSDPAALESALANAVAAAAAAWPEVKLAAEEFVPYLAIRLPAGDDPVESLAALQVADLYLACACSRGDPGALAAFDARCLSVVDLALARMSAPRAVVDEVKQMVRRLLLVAEGRPPRIVDYAGRGDLRGFVRVTAVREALHLLRRGRPELALDTAADALGVRAASDDPELAYLKDLYRAEFKIAFREAMGALSDRQRNLIAQHFLDGLTLEQMAALYRVHRATVVRWLAAAREALLRGTHRAMTARLKVRPAELDSILRLIDSQLDVSIPPALRAGD
jgi:RNA polymerase sigma-70 factor (ECF subfamily)